MGVWKNAHSGAKISVFSWRASARHILVYHRPKPSGKAQKKAEVSEATLEKVEEVYSGRQLENGV